MTATARPASAHLDTFSHDHLPPIEQWPELIFSLPELQYPERLNCCVELLDSMCEKGYADKIAIRTYTESWTYSHLLATVNRTAQENSITRHQFHFVT